MDQQSIIYKVCMGYFIVQRLHLLQFKQIDFFVSSPYSTVFQWLLLFSTNISLYFYEMCSSKNTKNKPWKYAFLWVCFSFFSSIRFMPALRWPLAAASLSLFFYFRFSTPALLVLAAPKNMPFLGIHFHPSRIFNLSNSLSAATCSWKIELLLTFLAIFLCSINQLSTYIAEIVQTPFSFRVHYQIIARIFIFAVLASPLGGLY